MIKTILLFTMVAFYLLAGINHFINPKGYLPLFPSYLKSWAIQLNIIAGLAEIMLAVLLLFPATKVFAGYCIILMLIAFIPSHIYMIQKGNFPIFGFTVTPTISLIRLLVFQPLFIYWAYYVAIKLQ
ncbi:MAG: hypothetical protein ACOVNR_06330 [Chitinophagaceae bacterium]